MSCDTPQHNILAELAFLYITGMAHAMMGGATMMAPDDLCTKVALETIAWATQLDGLVVVGVSGKTAMHDMHMFGAHPKWSRNLCIWGKVGVMTEGKDSKTGTKGAP
jgi:hypothetical protein